MVFLVMEVVKGLLECLSRFLMVRLLVTLEGGCSKAHDASS